MSKVENALSFQQVIYKAIAWDIVEDEESIKFYCSGRDESGKSVTSEISEFTPWVYLPLPEKDKNKNDVVWTKARIQLLVNALIKTASMSKKKNSKPPLPDYELKSMYHMKGKKTFNAVKLRFPTNAAKRCFGYTTCKWVCYDRRAGAHKINGLPDFNQGAFYVLDSLVDPLVQFATEKNLELAGWIQVTEHLEDEEKHQSVEERKFASTDINLKVLASNVKAHTSDKHVFPTYCSFDIECNSKNHNSKLPDSSIPENKVFQIVCRFGTTGNLEEDVHSLSLFNPYESAKEIKEKVKEKNGETVERIVKIECSDEKASNITTVKCNDEDDLLLSFTKLIQTKDPDMFIGHNIMKFDWPYMIERAKLINERKPGFFAKFMMLSRLKGKVALEGEISWSSKAYKKQIFKFPKCIGRIHNDTLIEIERNYRLPIYSLNAIAKKFLKEEKDDITPRQLFMIYQITNETHPIFKKGNVTPEELVHIKKRVRFIFPLRKSHGVVRVLRAEMLKATCETIESIVRKGLTLTKKYCEQDTHLPVRLVDKLNLMMTMTHMSNVMQVPISYLHTRGVGIKVLAQVYRELHKAGIALPMKEVVDALEKYQGAMVIEAHPGDYKNVATLDFMSLYPTTMIAFNICHTTILEEGEKWPEEDTHRVKICSHVGCPHDPLKRKKKAHEILCVDREDRFKKAKIVIDDAGNIKIINEGVFPRLLKNLLSNRKGVKKEMFKVDARIAMHEGKATEEDIEYFRKIGFEIVEPGSLGPAEMMMLKLMSSSKNAHQLSIKLAANSAYGALGAKTGDLYLLAGAESVTAMGRELIMMSIKRILQEYEDCKLVYGDTDSCMITFPGKSLEETFVLAEEASKMVTHYLKTWLMREPEDGVVEVTADGKEHSYTLNKINAQHPHFKHLTKADKIRVLTYVSIPLDLEFENVYRRFLLLTKKRYLAYMVNKKGKDLGEVNKGVALTRRDNSAYLKNTLHQVKSNILDDKPEQEVMYGLYDRVQKLFTRQITDEELVIYTGIGDLITYAKKETKKFEGKETVSYIDANKDVIIDPIGPDDPRLVYSNLVQCLLALKMTRRGTDVPPNTKLEYIYLDNPTAEHQGDKAEDYTYYIENKDVENLKPDYFHYINKQIDKPVTELLRVKYPKENIIYEKLDDAIVRVLKSQQISEIKQQYIARFKEYRKPRPTLTSDRFTGDEVFGWDAWRRDGRGTWYQKEVNEDLAPDRKFKEYVHKGVNGKARHVLESITKGGFNDFSRKVEADREVIAGCERWRSRSILDSIYKHHGLKRRQLKKPTQTGAGLGVGVGVVLMEDIGGFPRGTYAKIITVEDRGNKDFYFSLKTEGEVLEDIPRSALATYYKKDSTVITDMFKARVSYKQVVDKLNVLFSPFDYAE